MHSLSLLATQTILGDSLYLIIFPFLFVSVLGIATGQSRLLVAPHIVLVLPSSEATTSGLAVA